MLRIGFLPALAWAFVGTAHAATLTLEGSSLAIEIYGYSLPDALVAPLEVSQVGAVPVFVSSGGGSFVLPAGAVSGSDAFTISMNEFLSTFAVDGFNLTGSFAPGGGQNGGFGGSGGLSGTYLIGALGGLLNLSIPLSPVGAGGSAPAVPASALAATLIGSSAWTTGAVVFTGLSLQPSPPVSYINTVSRVGFDNRSASHRGTLLLVTPIRIASTSLGDTVGFASLELSFVPEPGTALLGVVLAGVIAWLGAGRARRS